ncbi:hypothetical protein [Tenacibaculum finnmarkense]|uniref:hypothetical protein n=1 Tax=Tenacibaculum finnmarkense TaxID=2781243 RepID=UPI001E53C8E6|nr:hypothetical protein [Tenacibaculum finnmarkense]MCD8423394.1 hypothetical protein [Tenacibaculum finnmarkense genomovar ulcerans]MCD8443771.1 hypothetical protein [Tenacibaculum finnmarkense genomovar ulcerans]MCG8235887.1 hypothetical protein [Tenacibaculum finnmarkense genomovar ulcerans]MCG8238273.1 hypothetical protein [Tenacibaculum finnmarkense genomovar ulcerans]MCG8807408.1 hypothetical protein [Tenacibaculum finnmarkense]
MKNFGKFTLAVLLAGTLGLTTSCVKEEMSSEVEAIYKGHAELLAARKTLKTAELEMAKAKLALALLEVKSKENSNAAELAQNELAIATAQNALELANQKHITALATLKAQVEDIKSEAVRDYLGKFFAEKGLIISAEAKLAKQNRQLVKLKADVVDVFNQDNAIKGYELDVLELESDLLKETDKLALLEAVLSDPTTIGAQVLEIQKAIDALKATNKEKTARIKEINETELSAFGDYSDNLNDYQNEKYLLNSYKRQIEAANVNIADTKESLTETQEELTELTGGTAVTYEVALSNKTAAKALYDQTREAYQEAQGFSSNYSDLINNIANKKSYIASYKTTIESLKNSITSLEAEYKAAKLKFDANPSDVVITSNGYDGKAGIANDSSSDTYYKVISNDNNEVVFGTTAYTSYQDVVNNGGVVTDYYNDPTVGEFFNVERDDQTKTNTEVFNEAQQALAGAETNLSNNESWLTTAESEVAEYELELAEFDATALSGNLATARTANDKARKDYYTARDVVTSLEAVISLENNILSAENQLTQAQQNVVKCNTEITRLEALIDTTKLAEYQALKDKVTALELEVTVNKEKMDNLQGDIVYFNGLELELEANEYSGDDYDDRMEQIKGQIKTQKVAVLEVTDKIEVIKHRIEQIKKGKTDLTDQRAEDIASLEEGIAVLEVKIEKLKKSAEMYKALMESALSA